VGDGGGPPDVPATNFGKPAALVEKFPRKDVFITDNPRPRQSGRTGGGTLFNPRAAVSRPVPGGWARMTNHLLLAAAVIALIALARFAWLSHARSARRRQVALDAYAEREIARNRPRKALPPGRPRTRR
jgi:hypothetical protein